MNRNYRQMPRLITITTYPFASHNDFSLKLTRQFWLGINAKRFRTREDALRRGYR